jgi:flagellar basal body P-ring protein FlgI
MKRRHFLLLASTTAAIGLGGCSWFNGLTMRSQSPDESAPEDPQTLLVGDLAVPTGMHFVRVEAVGLVTGLHGTGSDPAPSPQRSALLEEMQTRGVINPNSVLASGDVSLVVLEGILRPGVQKGDRFDVELRVPSQSETTSLRGGYLLETRLSESAVLGNQLHHGNLLALAKGPVMVDPTADPKKDHILVNRGRVLGGGIALKSRPLGLVLTSGHHNVIESSQPDDGAFKTKLGNAVINSRVANAVNKRFHTFQNGRKAGVAKAIDDQVIELQVHPRYKDNITRYVQVVRALPVSESATERMQRIAVLRSQLLEPATAADAAIRLEAIGVDGVDALLKGIQAKDPEVRFYAAEALAFLDRREAAEPLGQIARDQPAFRVFALAALSAMQEYVAYEQLRDLLAAPSAETRYGAFRALWAMNQQDPLVKGESLGGQFNYHVLDVAGPPMIHVTRSRVSEIVIFGRGHQLRTPLAVSAGNEIMVTSSGGNEISVSKFSVQEGDQKRLVSTNVDDVIRAIVELGGTYPDVVQAMQEAKTSGALPSRFEVDALPEAGRTYDRIAEDAPDEAEQDRDAKHDNAEHSVQASPARPLPELFATRGGAGSSVDGAANGISDEKPSDDDSDEKTNTKKGFFAKMLGR